MEVKHPLSRAELGGSDCPAALGAYPRTLSELTGIEFASRAICSQYGLQDHDEVNAAPIAHGGHIVLAVRAGAFSPQGE